MELKELRDKLNKKHIKVRVPYIQGEAYACSYARVLKSFTREVVNNFSNLVEAIFEEVSGVVVTYDASGDFEFWDNILKSVPELATKRKKNPFKEMLEVLFPKTARKNGKVDYTLTLSSLFDYYTDRAELLARDFTEQELLSLYGYVHGKYKSRFPNLTVSGEYYENIMQAVVNENLALIKSIPEQVVKDMQVVLSQGIISGNRKELVKNLSRIKDVNENRAEFIARDQIHKAVEGFKQVENSALGIEYYEWLTAEDERVSEGIGGHRQNNKRIFRYGSNEAIISYSSKRGFYYGKPGDRPNCRCVAIGVIPDIDEKIVKSKDGYGYEIVKRDEL